MCFKNKFDDIDSKLRNHEFTHCHLYFNYLCILIEPERVSQ